MTHPQPILSRISQDHGPKPIGQLIEVVLANYPILSERPPIEGESAWFGELPDEEEQADDVQQQSDDCVLVH